MYLGCKSPSTLLHRHLAPGHCDSRSHHDVLPWCYDVGMRTTLNISDQLLEQARAYAGQNRRTLGEVVDDGLRLLFRRHEDATTQRVKLPTDGGSGLQPGVDLEDKDALADLLGDNRLPGDAAG